MAAINVPERYRRSLSVVRELPDSVIQELEDALRSAPRRADPEEIAAAVAKAISLPAGEAEPIAEALASLYMFRSYADASLEDAIQGVLSSVTAIDSRPLDAAALANFRKRLERLLGTE